MIKPVSRCRSCDAEIVWARGATGKRMPVDAEPSHNGNVMLVPDRKRPGEWTAIVLARANLSVTRISGAVLHLNHFVTCRYSEMHRV